jgi:hypothetical protein
MERTDPRDQPGYDPPLLKDARAVYTPRAARPACIRTYPRGVLFSPVWPVVDDIHIEDIAHHLAHECRFGGGVRQHYSVAQHSVLVSWDVEAAGYGPWVQLEALLHDAAEAYLKDIPRPIKKDPAMEGYRSLERPLEAAIAVRFGFEAWGTPPVKVSDLRVCDAEKRDLTVCAEGSVRVEHPTVHPWAIPEARTMFLRRYADLYQETHPLGAWGRCRTCAGVQVLRRGGTEPLVGGYWKDLCSECHGDVNHRRVGATGRRGRP